MTTLHYYNCDQCGKGFSSPQRHRKYCCFRCSVDVREKNKPINCSSCGEDFNGRIVHRKYCSNKCFEKSAKKIRTSICKGCDAVFSHRNYLSRKYCSPECYRKFKYTTKVKHICKQCSVEFRHYKKYLFCSRECADKARTFLKRTATNKIRRSPEYKQWREDVLKRDGYTCQVCYKIDCYLEAHHIIEMSVDISLALVVKNGMTVCLDCHNSIHGWEQARCWDTTKATKPNEAQDVR